jgi:hypothetical protein
VSTTRLIAKYGNPGTVNKPNHKWRRENVTVVKLPWPMVCAYTGRVVTQVSFHKAGANNLLAALIAVYAAAEAKVRASDVWKTRRLLVKQEYGYSETSVFYDGKMATFTQQQVLALLHSFGGDIFGGSYVHRAMRGSDTLSTHAWAVAIDIDPAHNPMGSRLVTTFPAWFVDCFTRHGFEWGGEWKGRKDAMHMQLKA